MLATYQSDLKLPLAWPGVRQGTLSLAALLLGWFCIACPAAGQTLQIQIKSATVDCFEDTIQLRHVADVQFVATGQRSAIEGLDLDAFQGSQRGKRPVVTITKEQIRIRLVLAGYASEQFVVTGPDRVTVASMTPADIGQATQDVLRQQLADHFGIPIEDLRLTLNPASNRLADKKIEPASLELDSGLPAQLPLGKRTLAVKALNDRGQTVSLNLPVTIAVVRELVIAKQNINRGDILGPANIEAVRRPIANSNVRYASFDQVVGKPSQFNFQKYDLVKAGSVRSGSVRQEHVIKKNDLVNVIVRRGPLEIVLKAARSIDAGDVGQTIELINPNTRERIVATVLDSSTAEIRY